MPLYFVTDMINMISIDFEPYCTEWVHSAGDPISALAVYVSNYLLYHVQHLVHAGCHTTRLIHF